VRAAPCLAVSASPARTGAVVGVLAQVFSRIGRQPQALQTDRGPCFIGAEGGETLALPGRLTLWLWGHGIEHRVTPPGKPQRNGAVERWNGAMAHSWAGEAGGLEALVAVWNYGKGWPGEECPPYRGRAGWREERLWERLARVRVLRRVDRQGKLSMWDRPVRVGSRLGDRTVVLTFDAERRVLTVHDERGGLLTERALPWLTADWVWSVLEPAVQVVTGAAPVFDACGSSTVR
jgi:hypothetical protein